MSGGGNVQKRQGPIAQGDCYDNWECRPSCGEAGLRVGGSENSYINIGF